MDYLHVVAEFLLYIAVPILLAVLVPLLRKAAQAITSKATVEEQREYEALVREFAHQSVRYAEEWGRKKLAADRVEGGAAKMREAMTYVNGLLDELGLKQLAADKLRAVIEAALHLERPVMDAEAESSPATTPAG